MREQLRTKGITNFLSIDTYMYTHMCIDVQDLNSREYDYKNTPIPFSIEL